MNKADVIATFERYYQDGLMKPGSLTDDIAEKYSAWLRSKIAAAAQLLQTDFTPSEVTANEPA